MSATETHPTTVDVNEVARRPVLLMSLVPGSIVRYAYYAFIFSLAFESADVDIASLPLSRMLGFILIAVIVASAFLPKRRFPFAIPPQAFWCLAIYLLVYTILGINTTLSFSGDVEIRAAIFQGIKTLVQLLAFFWISYNLMQYERITRGGLLALVISCIVVAILQASGVTSDIAEQDRVAAFEADPNRAAEVLSLGLVALVGLTFGKEKTDLKLHLLFWPCSVVLALGIVLTGSRGVNLAVVGALLIFFLHGKTLKFRLKVGLVILLAIGFLGFLSYQIEPVRERWARAYFEEDTSGRDRIFDAAWEMFLEKPLIGWGPVNHLFELGSRLGLRNARDTHNLILWIFTESGLLGAVPFFAGIWLCWLGAWRSRTFEGALPMAMLFLLLAAGLSISLHVDKLSWVVLAYSVASGRLRITKKPTERPSSLREFRLRTVESKTSVANVSVSAAESPGQINR